MRLGSALSTRFYSWKKETAQIINYSGAYTVFFVLQYMYNSRHVQKQTEICETRACEFGEFKL